MNYLKLEEKGKQLLARFPRLRKFCKKTYQRIMFLFSKEKILKVGELETINPQDEYEYFFGYYDKCPWDRNDRYVISLRVKSATKKADSDEEAQIVVFDTYNNNEMIIIATTHCWNTQQACMAQWLGPNFDEKIIYNDFRDNKFCSVIYNFNERREEKVFDKPIYDVSKDGSFALTLDFSRLDNLRKGYGYSNLKEVTKGEKCPDEPCIWKIDLKTGKIKDIIKYTDLNNFETRKEMKSSIHKVNHIMISPNGKRFMVLHRWFQKGKKFTRLVTMDINGKNLYNLSDDNFVSHCCWKNNNEILSFMNKKEYGNHYYLLKDKTNEYKIMFSKLNTDGHCTYSPDLEYVVTDTYPNRERMASVYVCRESNAIFNVAKVFGPFKYDNNVRCDLHPRWNRMGDKICIDSAHTGKKELYIIPVKDKVKEELKLSKKHPKVSAVITTHNRKSLLINAIKSVQNQTFPIYEIIVVSDGSTDNTKEVVEELQKDDKRIKFIEYFPSKNGNYARNTGIKAAKGEYIAFLDDDDIWLPDKIELQINKFKENKKIGLVYTAQNAIYINQKVIYQTKPNKEGNLSKLILFHNYIGSTSQVMIKKEVIKKCGNFDLNLKALQDYDLWIRICQNYDVGVVKEPCINYYNNLNTNQVSKNTNNYIDASFYISDKYSNIINKKLTKKEQKIRKRNNYLLISKKSMRNNQKKQAFLYALKANKEYFSASSLMYLSVSLLPFSLVLKLRKMLNK